MIRRSWRTLAALAAAIVAVAALVAGFAHGPAASASTVTANPWVYQMDNPAQDGLVVRGTTGTTNPLIVFDRLGQPIAAVGEAGGLKVFGDNLSVNRGDDIFNSQITTSPFDPVSSVCVRAGQLWLGGTAGHLWRCESRYGGALGWWQLL